MKKFVLSSSGFDKIKDAEKTVTKWHETGTLKHNSVKLYKIKEVYDLKLKFIKRKAK